MPDRLTKRETQCLELLANGLRNRQIAAQLGIELPTVAMHLQSSRRKLGAATREHAVAIGINLGLLKVDIENIH